MMPRRRDSFLRTPIRADHQDRLQNLTIAETALDGNPDPAAPYPQTLEIRFDVAASTTEVQIALPWEGRLQFRPDSTLNHPAVPSDVTVARYPTWAVVGDLLLRTFTLFGSGSGLQDAFTTHLPLVDPVPAIVSFSKVRLTQDFLFTTLEGLPKYNFMFEGAAVASDDPLRLQKLIIKFLAGNALVPCRLDPADATKDQTLLPMPSLELAAGATTTFRIAIASASENGLSNTWFRMRPEDAISGELLVPAVIDNFTEQVRNPAHPHHSVIPARLIFQHAAAAAYAPDHGAATPVRVALTAALAGGRSYRKLEVIRPPLPGSEVSSAVTRPYPMYRMCWTPVGGGATESLRLPLSGRVYLPLTDDTYRFWVIPRSADPTVVLAGDHVKLSGPPMPPEKFIGMPATTFDLPFPAGTIQRTVYAHCQRYDAKMIWEGFKRVQPVRGPLIARAGADWGLPAGGCPNPGFNAGVCDFFISTNAAMEPYSAIYGYIRESAGRHGLSPEFLQVIFIGEGGNTAISGAGLFSSVELLDTFNFVGLDLILYRTGNLPIGAPPVPPEAVAAGNPLEIAEYSYDLVANGYVDAGTVANVAFKRVVVRAEAGGTRTLQSGEVTGWDTAIELVAAELHARLDEMVAYLGRLITVENERRFLAYIRFNSGVPTAQNHATNMAARLKKWTVAVPPDNRNVLFNTIQRLAITQWQEAAAVYRSIE